MFYVEWKAFSRLPLCRSTKSDRITYFQQFTAAELSSSAPAAACTSTLEADNHSQFTAADAAIKAIKRGATERREEGRRERSAFLALLEHSPLGVAAAFLA